MVRCHVGRTKHEHVENYLRSNLQLRSRTDDGPHFIRCPFGPYCKDSDLRNAIDKALAWLSHWRDRIRMLSSYETSCTSTFLPKPSALLDGNLIQLLSLSYLG